MKSSYITQEGINVFIVSGKIYLSYFINNSNLIELSFDSENRLFKWFKSQRHIEVLLLVESTLNIV
jgi:hypothetical protein